MLGVTEKSQLLFTKLEHLHFDFLSVSRVVEPAEPLVLGRYYTSEGIAQGRFVFNRVLVFL